MCGVAGVFHTDGRPASGVALKRMTDIIAHRGPDGEGHFVDGPIGLGHRRLSVLDLSEAGSQPMSYGDGRFVVSYNGEIYNFRELRDELRALGYCFRSESDTEVVLLALVEWGSKALKRFNGMFALAFWDNKQQSLLLARDRYGVKPLYFSMQDGTFLFGSENKAILQHPECNTSVDKAALLEYFTFQNLFTSRTLWKGIELLPAGHYLTVSRECGKPKLVEYWDYCFSETDCSKSEEDYVEELSFLFRQAVKRQLVSDVDVGAYLSGGMDSGSITAVAAEELPHVRTFTCGFDMHTVSGLETGFDERSESEYLSHCFGTEHYEMVLKPGDMQRCLSDLAWHLEEPRVGQSYPNYYIARLASKFNKVVLSGGGGDELFGGYPWRYYRAVVNDDFAQYVDKYYLYWQRLINNKEIRKVFNPIWDDVKHVWTRDIFAGVFQHHAEKLTQPEDYINHSLYFEAKTFLHGLLVVEDKLSMAHGLEARVPFLDNDLVDFAMRIPVRFKLGRLGEVVRLNENEPGAKTRKFFERTHDGKLILRKAMRKLLPSRTTDAAKQGFSAPDGSWFKGPSIDFVRETIYARDSPIYEFLDRRAVKQLLEEHLSGACNRRLLVWSLLSFDAWCRVFKLTETHEIVGPRA